MPKVVVEPTEQFEDIPEYFQNIAKEYLFDKEFDSAKEAVASANKALEQNDKDGKYIVKNSEQGVINFMIVGERVTIRDIPYSVNDLDISVQVDVGGNTRSYVSPLKATVKQE